MGDRMATVDMGRKLGGHATFWGSGELGPHLTQCRLGRGQPCNKWHLDPSSPLTTIDICQKSGAMSLLGGGDLGPYLTQCHLGRGLPPYHVAF